jgi:hypothetical protein
MRILPSDVVKKILSPLQQNAIWFVLTDCWCDAMGVVDVGDRIKMLSDCEARARMSIVIKCLDTARKPRTLTDLIPNYEGVPVRCPDQCEGIF